MKEVSNNNMLPRWPPIRNARTPLEFPEDNPAIHRMYAKRAQMDPRQIRRLAKNAKQRLGMRLQ